MRVAGQRHGSFGFGAGQRDLCGFPPQHGHASEPILQPQARGDENLVVAAAARVDLLAGIAEALDEARFDCGMAIFELFVEHEAARAKILGEHVEFALQPGKFIGREDAVALLSLRMHAARLDVEDEELAIEDHVFARQELLDARVDLDAGFLPQQI